MLGLCLHGLLQQLHAERYGLEDGAQHLLLSSVWSHAWKHRSHSSVKLEENILTRIMISPKNPAPAVGSKIGACSPKKPGTKKRSNPSLGTDLAMSLVELACSNRSKDLHAFKSTSNTINSAYTGLLEKSPWIETSRLTELLCPLYKRSGVMVRTLCHEAQGVPVAPPDDRNLKT